MVKRCDWALGSELEREYHDAEWGKINTDERYLFELLCLEGMQAGLSWKLILQKRAAYQAAFDHFDVVQVAQMDDAALERLLTSDMNIIKNRHKVFAIRHNAQKFLAVQQEFGTFSNYIWRFTDGKQVVHHWEVSTQLPAQSQLSEVVSADLKKRGFKFVGPVIVYSYLQAIGVINDHLVDCAYRFDGLPSGASGGQAL